MPETPGLAVIGCGHWGRNLVRNVARLGALRAVVDVGEAARARAQELAPGVAVHDRLEPVLSDPSIRGVMVATSAETHHAVASACLAADKDVFVEKPLTLLVEDARDLIAVARRRERILMVGHLLEYHPAITTLRDLVQSGELGKVRYLISNRLNLGKVRSEENALWSFAPHDISVILRLVGEMPFEVVATGGCYLQPNIADVTVTQLLFDNGVRSHIFVSWLHPFKEQKLVVIGSRRMATYDDVTKELTLVDLHVDWSEGLPIPTGASGVAHPFPADEPLRLECEHFLDCITTRRAPLTNGESGLRVLEILHAAQRSMITNGRPVQLDSGLDAARRSGPGPRATDPSPGRSHVSPRPV
jgi:predicted dehydrogenase